MSCSRPVPVSLCPKPFAPGSDENAAVGSSEMRRANWLPQLLAAVWGKGTAAAGRSQPQSFCAGWRACVGWACGSVVPLDLRGCCVSCPPAVDPDRDRLPGSAVLPYGPLAGSALLSAPSGCTDHHPNVRNGGPLYWSDPASTTWRLGARSLCHGALALAPACAAGVWACSWMRRSICAMQVARGLRAPPASRA